MLVFCCPIEGMLHTKVMDDGYMCGQTSMLQFLWTVTMLQTDVTKAFFAPRNFVINSTCYTMQSMTVLHYMSVPTFTVTVYPSTLVYIGIMLQNYITGLYPSLQYFFYANRHCS